MTSRKVSRSATNSLSWNLKRWAEDYGFGALVLVAVIAAGFIAQGAEVPDPVPTFALKSESLYRVEVGGGSFLILYLVILAFVLALNGRGFTNIGPRGVEANQVVKANQIQQKTIKGQEQSIEALERNLQRNRIATGLVNQENRTLREQMRQLQEEVSSVSERIEKVERR